MGRRGKNRRASSGRELSFEALAEGAVCGARGQDFERDSASRGRDRRREEREYGNFLQKETGARSLNLTGILSLKELAAFLKNCAALVSNDSGPVHIAAAVGTPTLTIFGRNQAGLSARRWKALGEGHRVIQKDVGCVVCLAHECTIGFECLKAVEVDEVFENLKNLLK